MAKVLVTGGCGYIGSHTLVDLIQKGHEVTSVDNLVNSDTKPIQGILQITGTAVVNHEVDLLDLQLLEDIFAKGQFDAIIHFAALKSVGESVQQPLRYHKNNLVGMIHLLQCQRKYEVPHLIFSSSCSVYGNASELPVTEKTPIAEAESPYARTKQICEEIIFDVAPSLANRATYIILRYFNPAGAHDSIIIGESSKNEANNLVPVITETAIGKREKMLVFGNDYPTRDGTCIRDYIHIMDLARAHTESLEFLLAKKSTKQVEIFNLGSGSGTTVLEAIKAFESVSHTKLNYEITDEELET